MIARGTGYHRGNRQAGGARCAAHLKYLEYRQLGEQESPESRRIFSKDGDHVIHREALDDVMAHTSTAVNFHKLVLSPGEEEPVSDYRAWARAIMSDLEERQGKELHWYAVVHKNTDHPHVHVILAGAGEDLETGKHQPVKLYQEEYAFLREAGHDHSDHEFYQQIKERLRELDRTDDLAHHPAEPPQEMEVGR